LRLFLGLEERRLEGSFEYLTIKDFSNLSCISKSIQVELRRIPYTKCRDGRNYLVPFPGFPGLFRHQRTSSSLLSLPPRSSFTCHNFNGEHDDSSLQQYQHQHDGHHYGLPGLFCHQLASLEAMHQAENSSPKFGALRGGILADAPGLGKTISTLALITSTAGRRVQNPPEFWNKDAIQEGWSLSRTNPAFREDILKTLKPIRMWLFTTQYQSNNFTVDTTSYTTFKQYRELESYVTPPYLDSNQFLTLQDFERYLLRSLRRMHVPSSLLELFRHNVTNILQNNFDKTSRKLRSSSAGRRLLLERKLLPSCATLIIVPDALLEHWFTQIHKHLRLDVFADGDNDASDATITTSSPLILEIKKTEDAFNKTPSGIVYIDGIGDMAELANSEKSLRETANAAKSLTPPPWVLAKFLIVITTFSRCKAEFQREVQADRWTDITFPLAAEESLYNNNDRTTATSSIRRKRKRRGHIQGILETDSVTQSSLLSMRFLRLVVDEGHALGTHETSNAVTYMINQIAAERRWVLSGTPTTGDESSLHYNATSLDQIQHLLAFLRHPTYGNVIINNDDQTNSTRNGSNSTSMSSESRNTHKCNKSSKDKRIDLIRSAWVTNVKEPFLAMNPNGREELKKVLKEIMIMHRKEDIKLPQPVFRQVERRVLIPREVELDLLKLSQQQQDRVSSVAAIAGCVASKLDNYLHTPEFQSLVDTSQAEYIVRTMRDARKKLHCSEESNADVRPPKAVVYSSNSNVLLSVMEQIYRLGLEENIAEIYESSSIADISQELFRFRYDIKESRVCPICSFENDVTAKKCTNTLIEVEVVMPQQQQAQQEFQQHRYLIEQQRIVQPLDVPLERMNGEPMTAYVKSRKYWKSGDTIRINIVEPHPLLSKRQSEEHWDRMGSNDCRKRALADRYLGRDWYFGPLCPPAVEANNGEMNETCVARLVKFQSCGAFHGSWYRGTKLLEMSVQRTKQDVFFLGLDAELGQGLDLSFVTNIFLLEPIEDAATLEQITSRAHRLGATGPVLVETIHAFFHLSEKMELALTAEQTISIEKDREKNGENEEALPTKKLLMDRKQEKATLLQKVVCEHCYRQFPSHAVAEEHEKKTCPRNPSSAHVADPYHLSSIYREIKPPPCPG